MFRVIERAFFPRFSIGESLLPACMEVIEQAGMSKRWLTLISNLKMELLFVKMACTPRFNLKISSLLDREPRFRFSRGAPIRCWLTLPKRKVLPLIISMGCGGISFTEDSTILDVQVLDGERYQLEAQYVLDGSGFEN